MVLYDPRADAAIGLNLTASAIWSLCDGSRSIQEITFELAREVGTEPEAIIADVERTVSELKALEIVTDAARTPDHTA